MSDTTPATDAGTTKPAGQGIDDDLELSKHVAEQTSGDLAVQEVFEKEANGATSDIEAAKDPA